MNAAEAWGPAPPAGNLPPGEAGGRRGKGTDCLLWGSAPVSARPEDFSTLVPSTLETD